MATYAELYELRNESALVSRVAIALTKAANAIGAELAAVPNHANRIKWARRVLADPDGEAKQAIWVLLAGASGAATKAQIQASTDTAIQTAVDSNIDLMATTQA